MDFNASTGLIAKWAGGNLINGSPDIEIDSITTDSRDLGKSSLFVPIKGEKYDGHDFIDLLVKEKRISAFLSMRKDISIPYGSDTGAILCDDTLKAYGAIASHHRDRMNAGIIGITGTNGKTTTKELLWSILSRKYKTLKNIKNYNNEIGVPYTLLGLKEEHEYAVIELGMNHTGEIDILSNISKPDIALITNIGEGHLEFLGSVESVAMAKSEIMNGMKHGSVLFLNIDTLYFDMLYKKAKDIGLELRTFGISKDADFRPAGYKLFRDSFLLNYGDHEYTIPLFGIHNVYNAVAAVAVSEYIGIEKEIIKEAFSGFKNIEMRSQLINGKYTILNDTYNSNPLSARYALRSIKEIFPGKRKVSIFSDMKELGQYSGNYHKELGKNVFESGIDLLLTWGDMAENIVRGARENGMKKDRAVHFAEKAELIEFALKNITNDDVILVKGSRSMKMEEVVEALIR